MDYLTDDRAEYNISVRVVRVELSEGCFENIIPNLPDIEFDIGNFKDLYHLRWTEENSFRDIKHPLCLKALHSKKYEYIVQEIWARTIPHNFCSEITTHIELEKHETKHSYQMNFAEAFKTCRAFLRIHDGGTVLDVEGLIAQNKEPISPGRAFALQQRFKFLISFCYR